MSGPTRAHLDDRDDPALDDGVLKQVRLIEFNGFRAVQRYGGCAVLPWRLDHLQAAAAGLVSRPDGDLPPGSERFPQALVRVQKGRGPTYRDLAWAWQALEDDGRLLVTGHNDLGIVSWCRRIAEACGPMEVLANHSHARVAWVHRPGVCPAQWLRESGSSLFNGGAIDTGSALLLEQLSRLAGEMPAPTRVLDLGCGAGHLGLAAQQHWPLAQVCFVDADARAIQAVRKRVMEMPQPQSQERAQVYWWDASEALPESDFEVIVCNPPCHAGTKPDLTSAQLMFQAAASAIRPGGRLLVVANRNLPYESALSPLGVLSRPAQANGFKVLSVVMHGATR